ncbi:ferredoxin [uncultured Pelagimonas sp.]|uniref:ferredoxin n=1 Tax=uncultured Pelagimonas sp. TaxID=1618102 RepID=UPI00261BAD7F|nr:ferredoxin [uncultured Pelagimonas sp.]
MIDAAGIDHAARGLGLALRGVLHPKPDATLDPATQTLALLGPDEPDFWGIFTQSPEYLDGEPDPMDRWSKRITMPLAERWQGQALFPSDGPPYPPFLGWATASGAAWSSPVGLLVHKDAGLFVSYRCAIALPFHVSLPAPSVIPCKTCDAPCEGACPVSAIAKDHPYDVARCKAHMRSSDGVECRENGCLVRRACPVATNFRRLPAQSAFHMAAFLKN